MSPSTTRSAINLPDLLKRAAHQAHRLVQVWQLNVGDSLHYAKVERQKTKAAERKSALADKMAEAQRKRADRAAAKQSRKDEKARPTADQEPKILGVRCPRRFLRTFKKRDKFAPPPSPRS